MMLRPGPALRDGSPLNSQVGEYCAVRHESVVKIAAPPCSPYVSAKSLRKGKLTAKELRSNCIDITCSEKLRSISENSAHILCCVVPALVWYLSVQKGNGNQGPVSILRPSYLRMAISMLKIRRPLGRLIFNMGIAIPGKTVFLIETAPSHQELLTHETWTKWTTFADDIFQKHFFKKMIVSFT